MRQQLVTQGIILTRTNFQEADRILTFLTADFGKITVIAKGARKSRSKLAGGIELLSVNELSYIPGRGEIGTLVSSRLVHNFPSIIKDMDRTMYAYTVLKQFNKITEQAADTEFFEVLKLALAGIDDTGVPLSAVEVWLGMHLLDITGHMPDFQTDTQDVPLQSGTQYDFAFSDMRFTPQDRGAFTTNHIKLLRMAAHIDSPLAMKRIQNTEHLLPECVNLVRLVLRQNINI